MQALPTLHVIKTLYLTRHAKSDPAGPGQQDFDRPLSQQGMLDAARLAERFAERKEPVDAIVSSTARRAITTARFFSAALGNMPVHETRDIYHADLYALEAILRALPDAHDRVMIFGHNPGFSELVEHLAAPHLYHLSPCTTVRIDLHVGQWCEVASGTGTMAWWDSPKRDRADL